jgi:pimeloyl-ACP methyl ester carboxylesterase
MPAVVVLPGLDATGTLHAPFLAAAGGGAALAYPPDEPLDYDALLALALAALPPEEDLVLVGESFSGPLALRIACARPVRAVVLVASFVRCPIAGWAASRVPAWAFASRPPRWALRRYLVGDDAPPGLVDSVAAAVDTVKPHVLAARVRAVGGLDARAALRGCPAPVLYLRGTRDRLVGAAALDQLRAVRDVSVVDVDAPHLVLQRAPEVCARVIAGFLG